jgi:hypothetical protein
MDASKLKRGYRPPTTTAPAGLEEYVSKMKAKRQFEIAEEIINGTESNKPLNLEDREVVNVIEKDKNVIVFNIWKEKETHTRHNYDNCGVITKDERYWEFTPKPRKKKISNGYNVYLMKFTETEELEVLKDTIHLK